VETTTTADALFLDKENTVIAQPVIKKEKTFEK
jgi:hypothetical protein